MRKASLLVLTSLILIAVSMLASTLLMAQWQLGATAKFKIKLPNGSQSMNVTPAEYNIGSKFNITVEIRDVTAMTCYGLTVVWNSTYMNMTRWFLSDFFKAKRDEGTWSGAMLAFWTNDLRTRPGYELLPARIGAFCGLGQTALGEENNVTGTFDICKIEFRINSYGPLGFYIWKEPKYYKPWPYTTGQPYLSQEGKFPEALHITYSGWMAAPGAAKQPYDVVWAPGYTGVANALILYSPYSPEAIKTEEPEQPIVNQNVTVTVTQTKAGFNGIHFCPITNVTIDWGDESELEWKVPTGNPPQAIFTHNYTVEDVYNIKVYCYAAGMPPDLAWYNITDNEITVVPEFPAYLIMPLFLTTTIIAVASAKIVWSKKPKRRVDAK